MKKNGGSNIESPTAVNESSGASVASIDCGIGSTLSDDSLPPLAEENTNYLLRFLADEEFMVLDAHIENFIKTDNENANVRGLRNMKKGSKVLAGVQGERATVVKTTAQKVAVVKEGEEISRKRPRYFLPAHVVLLEEAAETSV